MGTPGGDAKLRLKDAIERERQAQADLLAAMRNTRDVLTEIHRQSNG